MAAPNLNAVTTVNIDTAAALATVTMADLIAAITTGHAFNVESVNVANVHASLAGHITVVYKKDGTEYRICKAQRLQTGQNLNVLLGKPLYLGEGDSLRIQADADSIFEVTAPYTDVTDL